MKDLIDEDSKKNVERAFNYSSSIFDTMPTDLKLIPDWERKMWKRSRKGFPAQTLKSFQSHLKNTKIFHDYETKRRQNVAIQEKTEE